MLRFPLLLAATFLAATSTTLAATADAPKQLSASRESSETPADFSGGPEALATYLTTAAYPGAARASQTGGRVFVHFEISTTGKIEKVKAIVPNNLNQSAINSTSPRLTTDPILLKAATDLVTNMPAWQPAIKNGNPVVSTQTVPVDFYPSAPAVAAPPVYAYAEQLPVFVGNTAKFPFPGSIYKSIRYPAEALRSNIQGVVLLYFVVNEQGRMEQVDIIQSVHPTLDAEAVRVVKAQVASTPAMHKGKPVRMFFTIPVTFAIR